MAADMGIVKLQARRRKLKARVVSATRRLKRAKLALRDCDRVLDPILYDLNAAALLKADLSGRNGPIVEASRLGGKLQLVVQKVYSFDDDAGEVSNYWLRFRQVGEVFEFDTYSIEGDDFILIPDGRIPIANLEKALKRRKGVMESLLRYSFRRVDGVDMPYDAFKGRGNADR